MGDKIQKQERNGKLKEKDENVAFVEPEVAAFISGFRTLFLRHANHPFHSLYRIVSYKTKFSANTY